MSDCKKKHYIKVVIKGQDFTLNNVDHPFEVHPLSDNMMRSYIYKHFKDIADSINEVESFKYYCGKKIIMHSDKPRTLLEIYREQIQNDSTLI